MYVCGRNMNTCGSPNVVTPTYNTVHTELNNELNEVPCGSGSFYSDRDVKIEMRTDREGLK